MKKYKKKLNIIWEMFPFLLSFSQLLDLHEDVVLGGDYPESGVLGQVHQAITMDRVACAAVDLDPGR